MKYETLSLSSNEFNFIKKIFGENKAIDIIDSSSSQLVLFFKDKIPLYSIKTNDKHLIFISIELVLKNKKTKSIPEMFDKNYNYSIKNLSLLMNNEEQSRNQYNKLRKISTVLIRDKLIIVGEKVNDGEISRTGEFVNNLMLVLKDVESLTKNAVISSKYFPKTDLVFHLIGGRKSSTPINRVAYLLDNDEKLKLLMPTTFNSKNHYYEKYENDLSWMLEHSPSPIIEELFINQEDEMVLKNDKLDAYGEIIELIKDVVEDYRGMYVSLLVYFFTVIFISFVILYGYDFITYWLFFGVWYNQPMVKL